MSEPEVPVVPVPPTLSSARDIRVRVKEGLVNANDQVRCTIVDGYVKEEFDKRVKAATTVLEKIEALEAEARKTKPTFSGYTLEGDPIGVATYTQDQVKAMKENREKSAKLNNALELALTKGDYSKVYELGGK